MRIDVGAEECAGMGCTDGARLAGTAAIGLAVKMFWYRLVGFFRGKRPTPDE